MNWCNAGENTIRYVFTFEIGGRWGGVSCFLKNCCKWVQAKNYRLQQDIICVLYGSVEEIIFFY